MAYLYFTTHDKLESFKPIIDLNREIKKREHSLKEAQSEYEELKTRIKTLSKELTLLNEDSHLAASGFYKIKYDFPILKDFENKLYEVRRQQKELIQTGKAIICDTQWLVSGSKALGKKMTERNINLGLSAFNVQCDNEILKIQFSSIGHAEEKMGQIRDSINKLLEPNSCQITDNFFQLKLEELHLVYAAQEKIKKQQNDERLQLSHLQAEAHHSSNLGFVYILSNLGVFGEDIYKIGMTRHQNPLVHIIEMSDESLPFGYDVHAMIQSDDAAGLLKLLHQELAAKRINKINLHKDFFKINLGEIEAACRKLYKGDFKLNPLAEAKEWRQSMAIGKSEKKKAA
ncbi:MAG: DUF4041 domain-containing protein [Moraxellaceae bacterium]|nr:DUF4041 domain-containing protein [Pseudobdellovibrionaceae bacterium]